jgi:acyl-CoA thioesterase
VAGPPEWLGLEQIEPGEWRFELVPRLSRFDGRLYGGTGLALVAALMEAETDRDALWASVQFVASADVGEHIDASVEVLAEGRRTSQVRVTARVGDRTVLVALGAAGAPRQGGLVVQIGEMPAVTPPDECVAWAPRAPFRLVEGERGWLDLVEIREVPEIESGMALWGRVREHGQSRASLGFLADMVPSSVVRAAGRAGAGTSLDNAMRFGPRPTTEWVLIELVPHFASAGYLHGSARLWGEDGTFLAVGSQTAVGLLFD